MKTTITLSGIEYKISAKLHAEGVKFPNTDANDRTRHNHFKVTIAGNGTRVTFDYFGSDFDYWDAVVELGDSDLKNALECFMSDAAYGSDSFNEFCDNTGYDQDSRRAERIHKACVKAYDKAQRLFGDVSAAYNELQEIVNA